MPSSRVRLPPDPNPAPRFPKYYDNMYPRRRPPPTAPLIQSHRFPLAGRTRLLLPTVSTRAAVLGQSIFDDRPRNEDSDARDRPFRGSTVRPGCFRRISLCSSESSKKKKKQKREPSTRITPTLPADSSPSGNSGINIPSVSLDGREKRYNAASNNPATNGTNNKRGETASNTRTEESADSAVAGGTIIENHRVSQVICHVRDFTVAIFLGIPVFERVNLEDD